MAVEFAMQGQDQRRVLGDLEIGGRHLDALRAELGDFVDEVMRIHHDAVADDRHLAGAHDARRQKGSL